VQIVSLRISVLGSGSSGNSTFLASAKTRILIDGGLSRLQTGKRLASIGESLERIDAIIITHEHNDHIQGLATILSRRAIPVFMTEGVRDFVVPLYNLQPIELMKAGYPFQVGDLTIAPFSIPHDAADPVGFNLEVEGIKVAYATDLGYLPELVRQKLKNCGLVILESNHDLEMLKVGGYPWHVKQRIMSRLGHLSNDVTGKFLGEEFDGQAYRIILAHLSRHNNHPDIARLMASQALEARGLDPGCLVLADQNRPTPLIEM
jgi:phosphoribosyl 1,2-cyclic phosphodiesterase